MIKRISKGLCMLLIASVLTSVIANPVSAVERYYYKGAGYTGYHKDALNGTKNSQSSVVVVSTATVYDYPTGKEKVRAFTRCDVVNGIYGSSYCSPTEVSIRFAASYANGVDNHTGHFITQTSPKPSETIDLTQYSWILNSYVVDGIARVVSAVANNSTASVTHSQTSNDSAKRVIFRNYSKSLLDVPNTVAYNRIDLAYDSDRKGAAATFSFDYFSRGGYVTAKANAKYDLRIYSGAPYQPPLVLSVQTGEARVTHTVGI